MHAISHYARNVAHALKSWHHVVSIDVPMTTWNSKERQGIIIIITMSLIVLCLDLHSVT